MSKAINLILGSGAARGLAHIGVIRELERQGYEIRSLVGCSIGALIGGFYAAGKLDAYTQWVLELSELDVLRFLDISLRSKNGIMKGDKIMNELRSVIGSHTIETLEIPFTAVATDLNHGKEVWLARGELFDAIRASIAVPGLFTPHRIGDALLVDGGLLNPLPIAPATHNSELLTIAVNLSGHERHDPLGPAALHVKEKRTGKVRREIENFLQQTSELLGLESTQKEKHATLSDVLLGSFDVMQSAIARYRLAAYPPDILIDIPANICKAYEFYKAEALIESGAYWTCESLERYDR